MQCPSQTQGNVILNALQQLLILRCPAGMIGVEPVHETLHVRYAVVVQDLADLFLLVCAGRYSIIEPLMRVNVGGIPSASSVILRHIVLQNAFASNKRNQNA